MHQYFFMPLYLEILLAVALVFFILLNLAAVALVFITIKAATSIQKKTEETLETVQIAAYNVSENSNLVKFAMPLISFFSPNKKSPLETIFSLFFKK